MDKKEHSPENISPIENKEIPPKGRKIDFYLFRHAEAYEQGLNSELTEKGERQAAEAAQNLLEKIILDGGGVIKFLSSPVRRAKRTLEIMQCNIQEMLTKQKIENVRLMTSRDNEALRTAGVIDPLRKRGIEDPIDYWLKNPDVLEGKDPSSMANRLREVINSLSKLANRLPAGEKIYYVGITHEAPQAALLNQLSRQTLNELGGSIHNCESMKVELIGKSGKNATVKFRNEEMKAEDSKSETGY